jgi:hypothetical protein
MKRIYRNYNIIMCHYLCWWISFSDLNRFSSSGHLPLNKQNRNNKLRQCRLFVNFFVFCFVSFLFFFICLWFISKLLYCTSEVRLILYFIPILKLIKKILLFSRLYKICYLFWLLFSRMCSCFVCGSWSIFVL